MTVDIHPQTLCPRRAGLVKRYHVWPVIHGQDVASHTWQLMRIMLALCPDCPRELLVYAMVHDIGEVLTGDVPYPVKAGSAALREAVDDLDALACDRMSETFLTPHCERYVPEVLCPGGLTKTFFKMCEMLEMWEFGLHEVNLGNRYAAAVAQRCWAHAVLLRDKLADAFDGTDELDLVSICDRFDVYTQARAAYETDVREGADANV